MTAQRHRIVVEGDDSTNYSAYSPDVPGVVATGATREECERELRAAIEFHLEGVTDDEQSDVASTTPPLIAFEEVGKSYTNAHQELVVLDRVSFEVPSGALVGVLGARRSGKSTLLRLMAGLEQPSAGVISFDGIDMASLSGRERTRLLRRRIALMSAQAWPTRNEKVLDAVTRPLVIRGAAVKDAEVHARRLLERVEIGDRADEPMRGVSLVDRPRIMLARALACEPSLLLMDEPAVMPSRSAGESFLELLRSVAISARMTLVLASEEASTLFGMETLMIIEGGQLHSIERRQATVIDFPQRPARREDRFSS